jgi:hypothetical protein
MPSFIVFALWVGANSKSARETTIIPEKMNESKGLLLNLPRGQTLEQTGFFGPEPADTLFSNIPRGRVPLRARPRSKVDR